MKNGLLFPDVPPVSTKKQAEPNTASPLAYQLSPKTFDTYFGQSHLIGTEKPLRRWIESDQVQSCIFWGPPGVGKTALARLMARYTKSHFIAINAVMASVKDIRSASQIGKSNQSMGKKTILFIDEIHRFNKAQQDALLQDLEKGVITLVGATTENPFFSVNPSIISRTQIFELYPLSDKELTQIITRALTMPDLAHLQPLDTDIQRSMIRHVNGDARKLINLLSSISASHTTTGTSSNKAAILKSLKDSGVSHSTDDHYDIISAFIKSVRGSDVDAALYWLARLLKGGEDPRFIARRLLILASEDIGNADPQALPLAAAALQTVQFIGMPESKYTLSQTTIYLAKAPKSNAATTAINAALAHVDKGPLHPVPNHLRSSGHTGLKDMGRGEGYLYPHDYPEGTVEQRYWDGTDTFYTPNSREK